MALQKKTYTIEGVEREVYYYLPAVQQNAPLLIVLHGQGGNGLGFGGKRQFELYWPEAVVIYPTGLITAARGACTETGWQHEIGEYNCVLTDKQDWDLKFFDQILLDFAQYIDPHKVFVHGFSSGGEFTYDVLWPSRGDKIAGIATSSAIDNSAAGKTPVAVVHTAGTQDPVVAFEVQKSRVIEITALNKCWEIPRVYQPGALIPEGQITPTDSQTNATRWFSKLHKPVVFIQYDGGHTYPDYMPQIIVKFLKIIADKVTQYSLGYENIPS